MILVLYALWDIIVELVQYFISPAILIILDLESRTLLGTNATLYPDREWITQQFRNTFFDSEKYPSLCISNRDSIPHLSDSIICGKSASSSFFSSCERLETHDFGGIGFSLLPFSRKMTCPLENSFND